VLIDRRWHLSIGDVRSFRGANSETDHYLVTAEDRERLSARKQPARKSDVDRFNLKKPSEMEVTIQFQIKLPQQVCSFGELK
jgi:hypothetical protein